MEIPGMDRLVWLFSAQEAIFRTMDSPDMVRQILTHISAAYRRRLDE